MANVTSTPVICSSGEAEITLSSPTNPSAGDVTFNFTVSTSATGVSGHLPGSNFGNGTFEQVLSNSSNNPVNVTYTVTPRANSAAGGSICVGDPVTAVVSVEPKPRLTFTPAALTVCEGVALGIDFQTASRPSTGEASVFYQLTEVLDPNTLLAPADVSGFQTTYPANYNSGTDVLNDILVNTALDQQPVRYSFTPSFNITSGTCTGDPVFINVTVSPRPTLLPFTVDPKCSAEPFAVDYSASVTEADLSSTLATWSFVYSTAGPGMSGASNGAGFELSQVVFNKTPDPATVTYTIKAKTFNCESNTIQVPVQIYPVPKVTGVPNSVNVCDDGTLNVPLTSNATGTQYTWLVDDEVQPDLTGASDQIAPVSGPINYLLSNASASLSNYTFEITPQLQTSLAGKVCVGDPKQLIINVAPPVDGRIFTSNGTNESFVCEGSRETILLEFDGLALFETVYKDGLNTVTLTGQGPAKQIQITPAGTTTFELVSVKDLFGCVKNINEIVTVNVNNTDAAFSIVGPAEACSPHPVSFKHDQQEGVIYTWKWFDGPDSTAYTAATDELNKIIKHTFENSSPLTVAKYKVFLETKLADTRYPECLKTSFQEVRVSPNINLGVFPDATEICSGETVAFTNTSRGPASHRWFYRTQGTTEENDVRTTISPSFQLVNNTTQNPIVYEIVYDADNGTCPASAIIPITVYRGINAEFDEGVIPPYVAGSSTVTFTNTSTPLEGTQFTYEWTFGGDSSPGEFSGTDAIIPVTYSLPGLKEVTLTVTNTVANASSLTCDDTFSKTIEILLPPLIAAFNASPLASCFPIEIEITENTSTGDVYKWQVIDQSGNIAATALSPNPIFKIVNPGTYDIFLEASSSITGQTAFAQKTGIEVFDNPIASLEARPSTLFIPDTELITFNFSTGANFYQWDFDDGTVTEDFEPKHFYSLEGNYEITLVAGYDHGVRDIDGDGIMDGNVICYDTAKRQIIAKQGGLTKIPNAFTPNANGPGGGGDPGSGSFNDMFLPITKGVAREDGSFVMQIYDRWGTLMFESRNQNQGWDGYDRNGNLVPAGVYVFKLDLRLADGQRITQVGDVTVIR
jgi:gliding motility-associated-like protein